MNIEEVREYAISFEHVSECFPFDDVTLIFKVYDKMFLLMGLDGGEFPSINVKCDPEKALELRDRYEFVRPGFHMNKKHWNTVELNSGVTDQQVREWIRDSYELVLAKVPRSRR